MIAALTILVGLALVTAGAVLVYIPAGFIVAGVGLMVGAWFYVRGSRVVV